MRTYLTILCLLWTVLAYAVESYTPIHPDPVSRFDGFNAWTNYTVENGLLGNWVRDITQTRDGTIWFRTNEGKIGSFVADREGPETEIAEGPSEVSSAGDIRVGWSGGDRWEQTTRKDLRYRYRLDGGEWTPTVDRTEVTFTALAPGPHHTLSQMVNDKEWR